MLFFVWATTAAYAQTVHWEAGDSGDPAELQLIFENCTPDGEPALPKIDGVTLAYTGSASQTSITNGSISRSTVLTYRARSQRSGPIQIPAFTAQTTKGALQVPAFSGGSSRSAADANITSRLDPGSTTVWAGEVFPLTYVLDVARRTFNQLGSPIEWNASPLVVEDWSKFEPSEAIVAGEPRLHINSSTRAYIKSPGTVTLNAANQLVNIQSGSIGFGLFQTPRIEQLSVTSNRPILTVRPLPNPTVQGFSGAVGQFKLVSKVVPTNAAVGEPITWTLELSGMGNWPDIAGLPSREVSKDFNVVQPQAKRTPAEGKLFDSVLSEDVVLVPTKSGTYSLGPVEFVYFDPASGSYKTASTPRTAITIAPAAALPSSNSQPASTPNTVAEAKQPAAPRADLKAPVLPQGLPRDPLPGRSSAIVPMPFKQLMLFVLLPFSLLPLLWGWLALQRARITDPVRPRREAHRRLASHIARVRSLPNATPPPDVLLAWQHDTAILWSLPHAAPAAHALPDATWSALWSEADQALYGQGRALPADWTARAEKALFAKRVPSFAPGRLFLAQNLLPFVATLTLVLLVSPKLDAEADSSTKTDRPPEVAYRAGDFSSAEKSWRASLAKEPVDPVSRFNLSLALAQQDRWSESVAHATASFVQDPRNTHIRGQLALAGDKAGFLPAPVLKFLPAGPVQSLAELAAPGFWQLILIGSSAFFVVSLGLLLFTCYRPASRIRSWLGVGILVLSASTALASVAGLQAYGVAADQRAVVTWRPGVLRSIPTEADTTQKTTALSAGTAAIQDRSFALGWIHLVFENGQSGWVRKDEVVGLWR